MKKILIVAHRWIPRYGGVQNVAYMQAEGLSKNNLVTIFTSKERGIKNICPPRCKIISGESLNFLYNHFGIPHPIFYPPSIKKLKDAILQNDIVIIHDRYYMSSILAYHFAKKFKKKIILFLHTPKLNYPGILSALYKINNLFSKKLVVGSEKIIGVSEDTVLSVLSDYNIERKYNFLYNPVKISDFKNSTKKFKKFTVLFVGRFVQKKGVDLLPPIAKILSKQNIDIIAVGDGPLFKKVKENSNGLNNIKFTGKITDREKLVELYKKSHLFLLTSSHGEAFPLVLVDAFAAGTPAVSTNGGAFVEVFNKKLGSLCKVGEHSKLCDNIIELKNNPSKYSFFSKNCKKFAKSKLDIKNYISDLESILKNE